MTAGTALQVVTSVAFTWLFVLYFRRMRGMGYACESASIRTSVGRIYYGVLLMELFLIIRSVFFFILRTSAPDRAGLLAVCTGQSSSLTESTARLLDHVR